MMTRNMTVRGWLGVMGLTIGLVIGLTQGGCAGGGGGRAAVTRELPLVIAHRGASGYVPEHTLAAYAMAIGMGADYIEPDVVLTRDGVAICSHDLTMGYTDVAVRYPGRRRADGEFYWIDFDLDEIKKLERVGPVPGGMERVRGYEVATLDEVIDLAQGMERSLGREIGIIPEPKDPGFHAREGRAIEGILLGALRGRGYAGQNSACIIQCFDLASLERMKELASVSPSDSRDPFESIETPRLLWLMSNTPTDDELERAAETVWGIGPNRNLIEDSEGRTRALMGKARALGLAVIPYTFKRDGAAISRFYWKHGVDGLFVDFPDLAVRARDRGER